MRPWTQAALLGITLTALTSGAAGPAPASEDDQALYLVGRQVGQGLHKLHLQPRELELVERGLRDAVGGVPPAVDPEAFGARRMEQFLEAREKAGVRIELERGQAFAAAAGKEKGAVTLPSGLVFRELRPGTGAPPRAGDALRVHLRGRLPGGQVIDDTYARNRPMTLELHPRFLACWVEGLRRMRAGSKAQVVCPAALAYGDLGRPPVVPPGATVSYELELLEILPPPAR